MKKVSRYILSAVLLILSNSEVYSQREKGEAILTATVGLSIWNLYAGAANVSDSLIATSTPTINAMYDYGITKEFSIGAAIGYNSFSFTNPNYSYINSGGVIVNESISVKYTRVNLAVRPLYHWGKREEFEWHAGIRLSYSFWTAELQTTDPYYNDEYYRANLYGAQAVFGSRAYFSEFVAVTFDVGIGSPYFASIGLSLKL